MHVPVLLCWQSSGSNWVEQVHCSSLTGYVKAYVHPLIAWELSFSLLLVKKSPSKIPHVLSEIDIKEKAFKMFTYAKYMAVAFNWIRSYSLRCL